MRVVFMGTPDFAATVLRALASEHDVVAVFTSPERPSGRGRTLVPSPVRLVAEELALDVRQPVSLRDAETSESLRALHPDVIVVAAYGKLLPRGLLEIPRLGCVNVHASLLPRYRGAAPIQRAILADDKFAGVCIMRMEETLDTGPVATCASTPVGEHTTASLSAELARLGAEALLSTLDDLEAGTVTWTPQDESVATYAAKIVAEDVALSSSLTAVEALRRIRASDEHAPARVRIGPRDITLLDANLAEQPVHPGAVLALKRALVLGFADGGLHVTRLRPAGKGDMDGAAFVCGARLDEACTWEPAT